jgi:hypothetical protein
MAAVETIPHPILMRTSTGRLTLRLSTCWRNARMSVSYSPPFRESEGNLRERYAHVNAERLSLIGTD